MNLGIDTRRGDSQVCDSWNSQQMHSTCGGPQALSWQLRCHIQHCAAAWPASPCTTFSEERSAARPPGCGVQSVHVMEHVKPAGCPATLPVPNDRKQITRAILWQGKVQSCHVCGRSAAP